MKRCSLLVLTSLMTFTCCGGSNPALEVKMDQVIDITIHTELVSNFFQSEKYDYADLPAEVNGRTNQGDNLPIQISWKTNNLNLDYKLVLDDFQQKLEYTVRGDKFNFYNYKLDTPYSVHIEYGNYISEPITFTTPKGFTRTINVEGVSNFRDLGDTDHIKQGLLYRCMTFENNTISGSEYKEITAKGIEELRRLGIKSEMDLRKANEIGDYEVEGETAKYAGLEGFDYRFLPLHYGGSNIIAYTGTVDGVYYDNPAVIKELLEYMAVEDNYPMAFHCVRGTDRTGCIAYIIKGLLGVDEDDINKDFIFSDFYNIGSPVRMENNKYSALFKKEEGETLKDKISNYLQNKIGVSEANINSIINILKVE